MIKKILFILLVLLMSSLAQAADAEVPATGQTICYDGAGVVIACAGTGQDGEMLQGVAWPNPRFTDNGDGTVSDNLTGLMWMTEANCIGNVYPIFDTEDGDADGRVSWQRGLDFVAAVNNATYDCNVTTPYTDWRLPNIRELESLVDLGQTNPALPAGHPFTGVVSWRYWSSSSVEAVSGNAWYVRLDFGLVFAYYKDDHADHVWPVRAGQ